MIKSILNAVFCALVCVFATGLIIVLVVVESPYDPISYVALSFMLFLDGLIMFLVLPKRPKRKFKPKTVSTSLVSWLCIVAYCCIVGLAFLINACILAEALAAKIVTVIFSCIFGGIFSATSIAVLCQFADFLRIKRCLKRGIETTATFVSNGKFFKSEYIRPNGRVLASIAGCSIVFEYTDATGTKKTAKSKCVFSRDEAEQLEKAGTFKIKYNDRTTVIAETFEPKEQEGSSVLSE